MGNAASLGGVAFDARYVNDRYHGIGRHAYNLLEALTRIDPDRRYVVFYHPGYRNTRFDLTALADRPNVELRAIRLPLYSPMEQFTWPIVLSKAGVDLFHSPYVLIPLLAPVLLVMTVHDLIFEQFPQYRPRGWLQRLYCAVTRLCIRRAHAVLTVSEAVRRKIPAYYRIDVADIHVVGNAVDGAFQRVNDAAHLRTVRERYRLPPRFALTLGAGRPHKNVEVVVDALARLNSSLAPVLVIAGDHDPRFIDGVGERIRAYGVEDRVCRPGAIREADLPAVYSLADVCICPSLVEGFGLPSLEAMACGTPVIASTTPGLAEAVGDAALTFDPGNAEELATLLGAVFSDKSLQSALSERGLERARAFSWDLVARRTLAVYASAGNAGRDRRHGIAF